MMAAAVVGTTNELDRKGISRDAPNGANPERPEIPKLTVTQLLKHGEDTLESMQQ